jgi:hypothetical protein
MFDICDVVKDADNMVRSKAMNVTGAVVPAASAAP